MTRHDHELHTMMSDTLTLAESLDVTDVVASRFKLVELHAQLDSIRHHIDVVETLVVPVLEHTAPGSTVAVREMHGIVNRGLVAVCDRVVELEIALDEQRRYCDELAVDLYLALASLALRTAQLDRSSATLAAAA